MVVLFYAASFGIEYFYHSLYNLREIKIQEDYRMFGKKTSVKRGLKIIIVGCGKVGVTLVE